MGINSSRHPTWRSRLKMTSGKNLHAYAMSADQKALEEYYGGRGFWTECTSDSPCPTSKAVASI